MEIFIGATLLAVLIEGTMTHFFGEGSNIKPEWMRYFALILGIGAATAYKLDILAALGLPAAYPLIGYIATGLIIGRGSNYVNDFVSKVRNS